jgi:hypothetical protein
MFYVQGKEHTLLINIHLYRQFHFHQAVVCDTVAEVDSLLLQVLK